LSAEWALYLTFPILAGLALFGRGSTAALLVMISAAASVLTVCFTGLDGEVHRGPLDAYDGATWEPLLRCLAGFLIGLLSYRFVASKRASEWVSGDVVCAATLGLLFICLAARFYDLLILPLFPLVVVTLYTNRGRVGRFLGGKYFNKLGLVSYSVYLVHPYLVETKPILMAALHRFLPVSASALSGSIIVYAALLLISAIAYQYIEVPGRRFIIKLSRRCTWARLPSLLACPRLIVMPRKIRRNALSEANAPRAGLAVAFRPAFDPRADGTTSQAAAQKSALRGQQLW
jgi:peptidoglycan/LPS O-acetylase OafA/YrhL